jgi:DNA modification methylase
MANVKDQVIKDEYSIYNGDCIEVLRNYPDQSTDFWIYSPPFGGLYQYSSDERDLSNCLNRDEFFEHYEFVVAESARLIKPGRMVAVHCMDIPSGNTGLDTIYDFPGDLIRLHERHGFKLVSRRMIWKEPLTVRNRTMTKSLSHKCLTLDSTKTSIANADQLLVFRSKGKNEVPVTHTEGMKSYAGAALMPPECKEYENWKGSQLQNKFSHWIWRQYASCVWMDVRIDNVLPYRNAREDEEEKHSHPLQLDTIERGIHLYSNPGEIVLTPFMGVGSEVYSAVANGRKGIGIELKESYYRQAVRNINGLMVKDKKVEVQLGMFASGAS